MYSSPPTDHDHDSPMDTFSLPSPSAQYFDHLVHGNEQQQLVMMELQQMFCLDKSTLLHIRDAFSKEIKAGLLDDRSSDLNMIPTFVTGKWTSTCTCEQTSERAANEAISGTNELSPVCVTYRATYW